MKISKWMRAVLLCLSGIGMFCCHEVAAQDIVGSLRGTVLDAIGAIVANAKITAISAETALTRSTTSDSKGNYVLVALPVGHYRLEAEAAGFKKYVQEGISLDVNQAATVSIQLTVGCGYRKLRPI